MKYIQVDNYVIRLRAYPNREQRKKIDQVLHGLRVAYNVTAYEISKGNVCVTKPDKKDETVRWPDFSACMKKTWLDYLRENYPDVQNVPATSLSSSVYGIFNDMKKSWENFHPEIAGKQARTKKGALKFKRNGAPVWKQSDKPVKLPCGKWEPVYYSNKKPRTSFTVQTPAPTGFVFNDNSKTVFINVSGIGKVKTRGWRFDLRFGSGPNMTFQEFYNKTNKKAFGVTVSKDNCGDYWIVVKLQTVWLPVKEGKKSIPIGIDVGLKDLAITSDGNKYENKKFARIEKRHKRLINKKLSRRWGWSNIKFREAHKKDKTIVPSHSYERTRLRLSKLDRKIADRRANWNNEVTSNIVRNASFIGIESLNVKGMMANRHLAYSVSDAGMYDVLSKLKYKSAWKGIQIIEIGRWEPSSQLCHVCGYQNKKVKNLNVREWTCPECGTHHDRDVNAAINIMNMAQAKLAE